MGYSQRTTVKLLGEHPKTKYVVVPKGLLLDRELTADARLVGMYLLSLSDGWEIGQRAITEALGLPKGSHRTTNAIQLLVKRGWLRHNEYKKGQRIFKHEYVMHRDRRFSDDESSSHETNEDADQKTPSDDESSTLSDDVSSSPPKYQKKHSDRNSSEMWSSTEESNDHRASAGAERGGDPADRSTVIDDSVDSIPVVGPVVGALGSSSACGVGHVKDISKGGTICRLCERPIDKNFHAAHPCGGGSAHWSCIDVSNRDPWAPSLPPCLHCGRDGFSTVTQLNAHARMCAQVKEGPIDKSLTEASLS